MDKKIQPFCPLCHKEFSEEVKFCAFDGIRLIYGKRDSLEGKIINKGYEIIQKIGEGGMGIVYKARQLSTGKIVAVKIIHSAVEDFNTIQRFKREVKLQSMLQHPNIVNIYDFSETADGKHYFVMDFIEGESLKAILNETGIIPLDVFFDLTIQICDGIQYAHSKGIIHRDLKTDNIFVVSLTHQKIVKILDFGLAKSFDIPESEQSGLSSTGVAIGTPHFISPEQARGETNKIGPPSDIYSLGVILYQMLTNRLPFDAATPWGVIHKHIHEKPASLKTYNSSISRELERIIMRCLEKTPENRFISATEIKRSIEKVKLRTKIRPPKPPSSASEKSRTGISFIQAVLLILFFSFFAVVPYNSEEFFLKYYFINENAAHPVYDSKKPSCILPSPEPVPGKHDYNYRLPYTPSGRIRIKTLPSKAGVWMNDRFIGSTPGIFGPFMPGQVVLEIRKKDYSSISLETEVDAEKTRIIPVLRLLPVSGNLMIEVRIDGSPGILPDKAEIKIGAMEWREVDIPWVEENLHSQEYQVQIRTEGYKILTPIPQTVEITAGKTKKIEFLIKPYPELFYIRGKEKISSGHYNLALNDFLRAVEINPEYWEAWYWYGISGEKTGNLSAACRAYKRFLRLAPKDSPDYASIKEKLPGFIKIVMKSHIWLDDGITKFRQKDINGAVNSLTQALKINPSLTNGFLWRATAYSRLGFYKKAFSDFEIVRNADPGNPELYYELGMTYSRAGRKDQASLEFKKAVSLNPDYADAYFEHGKLFSETGQLMFAVENILKAINIDPERFALPGYKLIRYTYQNAGMKNEAYETLKKYLALIPENFFSMQDKKTLLKRELEGN